MKFIIPLLFLVALSNAAPQQPQQFNYQNYLNQQTTTTPAPVHPPASIHYVNIGQELNGDYKFGYDTGKGPSGQSFREETRLQDGTVKGQYGYLDAQNKMRIVKYTAGLNGFSVDSDTALNDQQIAASKPTVPTAQYNPAPEQPRQQQQPLYSPRQSFQGLAQAAQSSQPQYLPAPNGLSAQQPYAGYAQQAAAQAQQAPAQIPQYNPSGYGGPQQLTPGQLQQQALAAARSRQAALARQQQQEAIIRQQQQAATEQILAQQRAALEAQQQAQQAEQAGKQNSYQNLAAQYAAAQPQYQSQSAPQQPQYQQSQYQAPQQPAPQQQAPQQSQYQAPTYQSQQYQPASYSSGSRTTELKPDVLSQFIQLPGTRLIQIDRPRTAKSATQSLLSSNSPNKEEEEYTGPVVINAALLNYDIGSSKLPNSQQSSNKKA